MHIWRTTVKGTAIDAWMKRGWLVQQNVQLAWTTRLKDVPPVLSNISKPSKVAWPQQKQDEQLKTQVLRSGGRLDFMTALLGSWDSNISTRSNTSRLLLHTPIPCWTNWVKFSLINHLTSNSLSPLLISLHRSSCQSSRDYQRLVGLFARRLD